MPAPRIPAAFLVCLSLAGCGGGDSAEPDRAPGFVAEDALVHVHGLGVVDGDVLIATHTGLWAAPEGEREAVRRGESRRDIMGFTVAGRDRLIGSGHPDLREGGPPHVGLIESGDGGESWRTVSLRGAADFHALTAAGDDVYGFDGLSGRLLASADGGRTWRKRPSPGALISIAADPRDGRRVAALAEDGVWLSADGARSWRRAPQQRPGLLAWSGSGRLYSVDAGGRIHASDDRARSWERLGTAGAQPAAVAVDERGDLYVAVGEGTVLRARNRGRKLDVRVSGPAS